eukprot:TRINITY_DN12133_c0_g2_i3.p1 TRINITY_DN12133_c0_g2~~TRINITY_DN12133_c0_g2_i3.p1  ORF type:complete len:225 (-),score=75.39 TRINITY_DN12133_c0_g2_i3:110-784(-)
MEKEFIQDLYDVLGEMSSGLEVLGKKLAKNIEFVASSIAEPLQQKPAIDERDDLLQSFRSFLFMGLQGTEKIKKASSVEELMEQMKLFGAEAEKILSGDNLRTAWTKLEEILALENSLIEESIARVGDKELRIESDIMDKKIEELVEKKELLANMIKQISDKFTNAKETKIYKDPETGLSINDIFIDFLLCQCENVDKRLSEFKQVQYEKKNLIAPNKKLSQKF